MKCPQCGAENREGMRFCDQCGSPLTDTELYDAHLAESRQPGAVIHSLCKRLRVSAILTLIAGILQLAGTLFSVAAGIVMIVLIPTITETDLYSTLTHYGVDVNSAAIARDAAEPFMTSAALTGTAITLFVISAFVIAMGIVNLVYAKKAFGAVSALSKGDLSASVPYRTMGKGIVFLIFNILFGGTCGIVGAAFGIAARSYVRSNPQVFEVPVQKS